MLMQDPTPFVDVSLGMFTNGESLTCLVCFSNAVSFSIAAWTFVWEEGKLVPSPLWKIHERRTFASFSASGSCLSTSLEKSLSGFMICPSDMMMVETLNYGLIKSRGVREEVETKCDDGRGMG